MKTNRHSLMAKGVMVLLALLVLVFALTYSWFNTKQEADATGFSAGIEADGDFEFAVGFYNNGTAGEYKMTSFTADSKQFDLEHVVATDGETYNLLHDYKPIDVTGDGRTLIRPSMSYGNSQINTASNDYSIAEPNVQYISFDLYFRSQTSGISVKLADGSWAKAAAEINSGESLTGSDAARKSSYGNFSKDAIVGAARVAFIPYDYSTENDNIPASLDAFEQNTPAYLHNRASFIWLPRPDLHLTPYKVNNVEQMTGWTLTTNSTDSVDSQHKYYNIFNKQKDETAGVTHETYKIYDNTITPSVLADSAQEFTRISNDVHIGNYYYTKVNVRIWIEGIDAEARRATSGGQFGINFKLATS